jgi:cytochrome oxidase assembly protein ShyY1
MYFKPSFALTLILITLAGVFLQLGLWQLDRKAEKTVLFERFENAPSMGIEQALAQQANLARVEAFGHYDEVRHVLLDNRIWNGRPGVQALTPFQLSDGRWLLVNRGWLPLPPDRLALPAVPTDAAARTIRGRLVAPGIDGPRLGEADVLVSDRWPQLVTYLELADVGAALRESLQPWIVQLDADDPSGFADRQWSAAVMEPAVHGAYAVQWLALCAATLIIWITLGLRRGRHRALQRAAVGPDPRGTGDECE